MQIAVNNLLRNVIEALSAPQHLILEPQIDVSLVDGPDAVEIRIGDNGPGLPEDFPSNQLLESSKNTGMGIGIFIVQAVMANHLGRMDYGTSSIGGAEIRLVFPKNASTVAPP